MLGLLIVIAFLVLVLLARFLLEHFGKTLPRR
jgi:hypothetical protein